MPVYEGLGSLGSDKHCVVIEIGHAFARCGFVNELSPRAIVRSEIGTPAQVSPPLPPFKVFRLRLFLPLQKLMDIKEGDLLFDALKRFIEGLYFKFLAVNPRDRKVLVVESVLSTKLFRSTLARVLFKHFDVS